jgi:hypothetical protein
MAGQFPQKTGTMERKSCSNVVWDEAGKHTEPGWEAPVIAFWQVDAS